METYTSTTQNSQILYQHPFNPIFQQITQLKTFQNLQLFNILQFTNIINSQNNNPKLYSLRNKILLNNLPTMANLNIQYPNLYLTSNCSFCNQHENTEHLLLCTLHSIDFHNILLIQITDYLNTLSLTNTAPQIILQYILLNSNPPDLTNTFLLLIQGIISTNCYEQINSLLKKSTNNFFIQLSNNLFLWFQAKIWNARNLIHHK